MHSPFFPLPRTSSHTDIKYPQRRAESGISSLISKYSTKSGWSAFFTPLESKIQNFGVTQTFISLSDLTRTDTGIITVPGFVSLASEYVTIVSEAIATDTNLAPTDKSSLSSDFEALIAGATGSASVPSETGSGSKGPSETATETGTVLSEQASPTVTIANPTQISAAATTQAALPTQTGGAGANMDMLGLSGVVAGLVAAVAMAL
jgi:hypothetical protein